MKDGALLTSGRPSALRAWLYLIRTSWQRQARAHLMVWIAVGLLLFLALAVALLTNLGFWDLRTWRQPRRGGLTYGEWTLYLRFAPANVLSYKQQADPFKAPGPRASDRWSVLYQQYQSRRHLPPEKRGPPAPATLTADPVQVAVSGAVAAATENEDFRRQTGMVRFTQTVVFAIFTSFLLPLCSLSFATEALGRDREQRNLLWTLTRPLPRWAIYLAKFVAVLPWCLTLNLGGFAVICAAAGDVGRLALSLYWPAIGLSTLAFAALFHGMGAIFRRPAVIAILYCFFLETVMGNLPGHLKRASINFYARSLMYDSASVFQLQPDRPLLFNAVTGPVAITVLISVTVFLLFLGCWVFSRMEYLDLG
jgi:ABC-2 type transport system permease protein